MTTTLPERAGRRCHDVLNPYHATVYFAPEVGQEFAALGIEGTNAVYLAGRAAALGRASAGTVTATFFSFSHELVSRHIPRVWDLASPQEILDARLRAADALLRRLLGEEVLASPGMAEAAGLALRATEACTRPARPLYAAHADLPVPQEPHLALWHAATLLREHRGDGHLATLLRAGLDPVEALLTHRATGAGMSTKWLLLTRGWDEEELAAGEARLRGRGLLDGKNELTPAGTALRAELEEETDRLDAAPYEHLGAAGVERLTELMKGFVVKALAGGAFPEDLRGNG
ncbi:hypothetical protein ACFP1Z_04065 [Streptomyces gamaensis]|uniref:SalK n=1 Tax=Streptomyces gamaensis TaxID=1763542 RepID=A0ABW0YV31_9ACTN